MWLARDLSGELWTYTHKPVRADDCWRLPDQLTDDPNENPESLSFFDDWFPSLTWEDEPVEVEIVRRALKSRKLWAARDEDGEVWVYTRKPDKCNECWDLKDKSPDDDLTEIFTDLLPELEWEDEPIEVEIVRKPKIQKKKCG